MQANIPASSSDKSILDLTYALDPLTKKLKQISISNFWPNRAEVDKDDVWEPLLEHILAKLTALLAQTSLKGKVFEPMSSEEAEVIVSSFSEEQLRNWKDATRKAVGTDDWTDLIQLVKLKNPKVPNVAPGVPIELKNAVVDAWGRDYLGDAHKILLKAVDDLHELDVAHNYAKMIPIIQSSGTGKSRTVDQAGKERILFPMCLREDLGKDLFAYPLTDASVRIHLRHAPATTNELDCKQYLKMFLSSLFLVGRSLLPDLFSENKRITYKAMAKAFYDYFGQHSNRSEFYERVVGLSKTSDANLAGSFNEFVNELKDRCLKWPSKACPILISLDEVHVLYTHREEDIRAYHSLYSIFQSMLSDAAKCHFGVICMSTASHISNPAPSIKITPSLRERNPEVSIPTPFTELPFDVPLIENPLAPNQENLSSVGSLEFTVKFGRPLFNATYQSRKHERGIPLSTRMLSIVQEKLSGRYWPPQLEAPVDLDSSSIAILSARLHLDLYPATVDARQYEQEMVRNHLRILFSVSSDGNTIVTGSPPEPFIAEASAQIMHYTVTNGQPYMNFWELLLKYMEHGLASQGATRELIGRGLSINAMDSAINNLAPESLRKLKYQTPVTVIDYYKALLTDEAWGELRHSIPANREQLSEGSANTTFEDAFKGTYFHFSHYGQANDTSPMQSSHAWAYWLRGTAIACPLNQELTDRMAPIYFPELGNVSPQTISVNLDQDQTSDTVSPPSVAIQSAEHLSIFSEASKLPYIAAVHCYALTKDEGITVCRRSSQTEKPQARKNDLEAPRYQIDFRGLSAYRIITEVEKSVIRKMINRSKDGVFATHSREYGIPALQRMLPVLASNGASADWYKSNNPTPTAGASTSVIEQGISRATKRSRTDSGQEQEISQPVKRSRTATATSYEVVTSTNHETKGKKTRGKKTKTR